MAYFGFLLGTVGVELDFDCISGGDSVWGWGDESEDYF